MLDRSDVCSAIPAITVTEPDFHQEKGTVPATLRTRQGYGHGETFLTWQVALLAASDNAPTLKLGGGVSVCTPPPIVI
jgi:hypothetical protein